MRRGREIRLAEAKVEGVGSTIRGSSTAARVVWTRCMPRIVCAGSAQGCMPHESGRGVQVTRGSAIEPGALLVVWAPFTVRAGAVQSWTP